MNRHVRSAYLDQIRSGRAPVLAARRAGVPFEVVESARLTDPAFEADERIARLEAIGVVEEAAYDAAAKARKDFTFPWLAVNAPERWGRMLETGSSQSVTVTTGVAVAVPDVRAAAAATIAGLLSDGAEFVWDASAVEAGSDPLPG